MNLRTCANGLTILRGILGLPVVLALSYRQLSLAWILILLAAASDILDGRLARKAGGGTDWGARLDPLTDKIFISAPLIWLVRENTLPFWSVWILISRELLITGWRSKDKLGAPASKAGKTKTIIQFISILMMMWPTSWANTNLSLSIHDFGWILFWPCLLISILSAKDYLIRQ